MLRETVKPFIFSFFTFLKTGCKVQIFNPKFWFDVYEKQRNGEGIRQAGRGKDEEAEPHQSEGRTGFHGEHFRDNWPRR